MKRRARLLGVAVAALLVAALPASPARAGETPVSLTLISQSAVEIHDQLQIEVDATPELYAAAIWIDESSDGTTWSTFGALTMYGGSAFTAWEVDEGTALGVRYLRARFDGNETYAATTSPSITQTVALRTASLEDFRAFNPNGNAIVPGTSPVRLFLTVKNASGDVLFEDVTGESATTLGTATPFSDGYNPPVAFLDAGPFDEGTHEIRASVGGDGITKPTSTTMSLDVSKGDTTATLSAPLTVEANHSFVVDYVLGFSNAEPFPTGAMTITDTDTDTVLASTDIVGSVTVPPQSLGTHHYRATYPGDDSWADATSDVLTVEVVSDTVHATGIGLDRSTFYPIKDGYEDTVTVKGKRSEAAKVEIKVKSPTGRVVRRASIAIGTGAYGWAWNGRSSAGSLMPAGTYTIVQTLTDSFGSTLRAVDSVHLSHKRLYTYSKTINKSASDYAARSKSWIGWQFHLPSATVYDSLSFGVYGNGQYVGSYDIGGWDFRRCSIDAKWSPGCVSSWKSVGLSPAWYSKKLSVTHGRHGRYVRAFAAASVTSGGTVYRVRLKVVYALLE